MSDISVALSTTRFISRSNFPSDQERYLIESNIPTCISQLGLGLFGFGSDIERFEHIAAQSCIAMVKTVAIDVKNKTVFIGIDPADEDTGLVIYKEMRDSEYVKEFFLRWEQTKKLIYEHHCIGLEGKPVFVVRGLWDTDRWVILDVFSSKSMDVDQSSEVTEYLSGYS